MVHTDKSRLISNRKSDGIVALYFELWRTYHENLKHIVDVTRLGGNVGNLIDMRLAVQNIQIAASRLSRKVPQP